MTGAYAPGLDSSRPDRGPRDRPFPMSAARATVAHGPKGMKMSDSSDRTVLDRLRADLQGTLVLPGDADYDTARTAVEPQPSTSAPRRSPTPADVADVQAILRAAARRRAGTASPRQPNGHGAERRPAPASMHHPTRRDSTMIVVDVAGESLLRVGVGRELGSRARAASTARAASPSPGSNPEVNVVGARASNGGQSMFSRRYGHHGALDHRGRTGGCRGRRSAGSPTPTTTSSSGPCAAAAGCSASSRPSRSPCIPEPGVVRGQSRRSPRRPSVEAVIGAATRARARRPRARASTSVWRGSPTSPLAAAATCAASTVATVSARARRR